MSDGRAASRFPVSLDVRGRLCVLVGGDAVCRRKARSLATLGADVVVITADVTDEVMELAADEVATVEQRGYVRGDLEGALLVYCAAGSGEVGRAVHAEARERGCLVNVADAPELCTFAMPSVLRRGVLEVAISSGGAAPAAAKHLRRKLSAELGEEWGEYASLLAEVRALAFARVSEDADAIVERVASSDLLERLRGGAHPSAEDLLVEFEGEGS